MVRQNPTGRTFAQFPTRRQFLAASIALATAASAIGAATSGGDTLIHQEVNFKASPARIYEALLDEKQFSAFSGAPAQIQREAGGAFRLFGGRVSGRNIELIPNQRIVQAWRVESWPAGVYAIVRFELSAQGSITRIVLDDAGFPPQDREARDGNWSRKYWEPLRKYLDS